MVAPECHPQLCAFEQINVSQMRWRWHAVICSRAADSGWLLGIRDSIRLINKRRIPEEQCLNYQLLENNQLPAGKVSSFFFLSFLCFFLRVWGGCFLRQGFYVWSWLSWNSLASLCQSAGIQGVYHHAWQPAGKPLRDDCSQT